MALPLIKFTQGATTDSPGRAVVGTAGSGVVCSNGDNTGVAYWRWTMLDVPIGSALPTGILAQGTSASTANFTPDVSGTYHVQLDTFSDVAGTVLIGTDIRDFIVPNSRNWYIPATKSDNNSMNWGGHTQGWKTAMDVIFQDLAAVANSVTSAPIGAVVADIPTLRGIVSASRVDGQIRLVRSSNGAGGELFRFDATAGANATDDGLYVIKPSDVLLTANGRWYRVPWSVLSDIWDNLQTVGFNGQANTPVPTLPTGIAAYRGDVAGVKRDTAALAWDETSQTWRTHFNTGGDRSTVGAFLSMTMLSLFLNGPAVQFAAGVTAPTISQAQSTTGAGQTLAITPQAAKTGSAALGGKLLLGSGAGDGAGAGGTIQFKDGAQTLGTFSGAGGYWFLTSDATVSAIRLFATGAGNFIQLSATGTNGDLYFDFTRTLHIRDATPNDLLTVVGAFNGTTTVSFAETVTSCIINQAARTSDSPTHALTVAAGSAKSAAVTNTTGGTLGLNSGLNADGTTYAGLNVSPTTISTTISGLTAGVQNIGSNTWFFQADSARNGLGFAAVGASQYVQFQATGASGAIYFDTNTLHFRDGGQVDAIIWSLNSGGTTSATYSVAASASWVQTARASDAATHDMLFQPQRPFATATGSNQIPGNLVVDVGVPTNGGTSEGSLIIKRAGTFAARIGPYDGGGGSYSAVYLGPGIVPSSTNFCFLCTGIAFTQLNSPSAGGEVDISFFGLTKVQFTDSAGVTTQNFNAAGVITGGGNISLGSTTHINSFIGGETRTTITVTNTNRTLDTTTKDTVIFVKTSTTGVSLTLPAPANGRRFRIIDINGTLSTNNLTLVRNGAEKINGVAASKVFTTDWGEWDVISDGVDWYVG